MTALMATFSAVMGRCRMRSTPTMSVAARPAACRHATTRSSVGGTMGKPSVHPFCWYNSFTSSASARSYAVDRSMCRGSVMTSPVIAKILCAPPKEMVIWQLEYRKNKATFHASPPTGASPHLTRVPTGNSPQPYPHATQSGEGAGRGQGEFPVVDVRGKVKCSLVFAILVRALLGYLATGLHRPPGSG